MIYPADFELKLGFNIIRETLKKHCLGSTGRSYIESMEFSTNLEAITRQLIETDELRRLLLFEDGFPSNDYFDLTKEIKGIRIPGTYLEQEQLADLKNSLITILQITRFLASRSGKYTTIGKLAADVDVEPDILKKIERIINEKTEIRDDASPGLKKIRKQKAAKQAELERKVSQSLAHVIKSGWAPEDAGITVKNGRLVIPMLSKFKRQLQGLVQDESATGQTVYMEPVEAVEINNDLRELAFEERREILRILIEFADFLRPFVDTLVNAYQFLGYIDYLRAKALFAIDTGGILPVSMILSPSIQWNEAIHPLLLLAHRKQKRPVVPLTITLNETTRILVISGPNAGGKSVCLKTVGLLQYMFQCGLLPTAKEDSVFGIFHHLFLDIGDEQSLENDLSTYSSKLLNIKYFIGNLDDHSLFLMDELGTGTDPTLGGAIAEASLEKIYETGAFGIVTTHFSNLKLLAGRLPEIENAAMLFDTRHLKPLFQLKIGIPGDSFAFEIAGKIGFPEEILKAAKQKTGRSQLNFHRQLQDLEIQKTEISKKSEELKVADEFFGEMVAKYQRLVEEVENSKKEILQKAREEAAEMLDKSNKLIEKTIREIRESQAEKARTMAARKELHELKEQIRSDSETKSNRQQEIKGSQQSAVGSQQSAVDSQQSAVDSQQSAVGSRQSAVRSSQSDRTANSKSKDSQSPDPKPQSEHLQISTSSNQHISTSSNQHISTSAKPYQSYLDDLNAKLVQFQLTLDLRGKRVDEAFSLLQRYIDDAIMLGINEVKILHGKGNGILRQITREYLASVKEVKKYQDEHIERGGTGITVVTL